MAFVLEQETDADIVPAVEGGVLRSAPLTGGNADEHETERSAHHA